MKVFIDSACKIGLQIAMLVLKDKKGKIGIIIDHHETSCSVC